MSPSSWEVLVRRYADGRRLCNCREAYADFCSGTSKDEPKACGGCTDTSMGHYFCRYGCETNKLIARDEIAAKALGEIL